MNEQNTVFLVAEQQQTDLGSNWIIFQMRTASSTFLSDPGHFSTDSGSVAGTCWISDRDPQLAIRSSWLKTISKDIFIFGILQSSFCLSSREAKRPHLALLKSEQSKCEQDNPPPASFARRGGDITVNSNSRLEPHRSGLMIKRQRGCIATFVAQQTGSMVQC